MDGKVNGEIKNQIEELLKKSADNKKITLYNYDLQGYDLVIEKLKVNTLSMKEIKAKEITQKYFNANKINQGYFNAKVVRQSNHNAQTIYQCEHEADSIYQHRHKANKIIQCEQVAKDGIAQQCQKAREIYQHLQDATIIHPQDYSNYEFKNDERVCYYERIPKKLTKNQIEELLGYNIQIVEE